MYQQPYGSEGQQLGAWYNNWGDLWNGIKSGVAKVTGGSGPTFPVMPFPTTFPGTTTTLANDFAKVQAWKDAVLATGGYPTRMPDGMANAGELAERINGPLTEFPNVQRPYTYVLAPPDVRAADARIIAGKAIGSPDVQQVNAIVPPDPHSDGGSGWRKLLAAADWTKYALIGGGVLAAFLILPPLLSAARRSNPSRRRRR